MKIESDKNGIYLTAESYEEFCELQKHAEATEHGSMSEVNPTTYTLRVMTVGSSKVDECTVLEGKIEAAKRALD